MKLTDKEINVFTELKNVNENLLIVKDLDTSVLDKVFNNTHRNNTLSPIAETLTPHEIATVLNSLYASKWNALYNAFNKAYEVIPDFSNKETKTESKKETGKNNNTNTNKVSAYNDTDFANDTEQVNNGGHETTNDNTITTEKVNGYNVVSTFQFLQNNELCSIIFTDISRFIFLLIYE